jgi:hypothetical protein
MAKAFSFDSKYAKFPNLLLVYVWNLGSPADTVSYALTQEEAIALAATMSYTKSQSWNAGRYVVTRPSSALEKLLEQYKMTPARWWERLRNEP